MGNIRPAGRIRPLKAFRPARRLYPTIPCNVARGLIPDSCRSLCSHRTVGARHERQLALDTAFHWHDFKCYILFYCDCWKLGHSRECCKHLPLLCDNMTVVLVIFWLLSVSVRFRFRIYNFLHFKEIRFDIKFY